VFWFLLWSHYFRTLQFIVKNLLSECLVLLSQSKYFLFISDSLFLHLLLRFLVLFYWHFSNLLRLFDDIFILSRTFQALFPSLRLRRRSSLFCNVNNIFVFSNFVFILSYCFFHLLYFAHLPSQFISQWLVLFLDEHVRLFEEVLHLVLPVLCLQLAVHMAPLSVLVRANRLELVLISCVFVLPTVLLQQFYQRFLAFKFFISWTHTNGLILNSLTLLYDYFSFYI